MSKVMIDFQCSNLRVSSYCESMDVFADDVDLHDLLLVIGFKNIVDEISPDYLLEQMSEDDIRDYLAREYD